LDNRLSISNAETIRGCLGIYFGIILMLIKLKEVQTKLKGTPMLGFLGIFSVNFEIPDYWGIGK